MDTKDENLLVKVVKKAVGLPTGNSGCGCGTAAAAETDCCKSEASENASTDCGCPNVPVREQEHLTQA